MTYDPKSGTIIFESNSIIFGHNKLFEIRNASHENAKKLAKELGLILFNDELSWYKYNPEFILLSDGSVSADNLRSELIKSKIPFYERENEEFGLSNGTHEWTFPSWSLKDLIKKIKDEAQMYAKELNSTP